MERNKKNTQKEDTIYKKKISFYISIILLERKLFINFLYMNKVILFFFNSNMLNILLTVNLYFNMYIFIYIFKKLQPNT